MLNRDDIVAVCPPPKAGTVKRGVWDGYVNALTSPEGARLLKSYGIETPNRMIGLMACVVAPETGLTLLRERGDYSAKRIVDVFGAHRHSSAITEDEAARIAAMPVNPDGTGPRADALFERAYGLGIKHCCKNVKACTNRNAKGKLVPCQARSLGNWAPGDGAKHPGVGLGQCTGRAAQEAAAKELGCRVEDLAKPINAIALLLLEWDEKDCNSYADRGDWVAIRSIFNTGKPNSSIRVINGLPEMHRALAVARRVITHDDFENPPAGSPVAANDRPVSLMASTEVQAAGAAGAGGATSAGQGIQNAAIKTASMGEWSWRMFLLHLLSDPLFWAGAVTIGGAIYWIAKRRFNFHVRGI